MISQLKEFILYHLSHFMISQLKEKEKKMKRVTTVLLMSFHYITISTKGRVKSNQQTILVQVARHNLC